MNGLRFRRVYGVLVQNKIRRKKELVPFALSMSAMWAAMSIIDLTDSFVSEFVARGIF